MMINNAKNWKPYWVEVREGFLEISTEYNKEPFTAFHVGVLKVRPSKEFPDRPDVLEFYDGDGFTSTHFFVFTYDPFDILEFFKNICNEYKAWRDRVSEAREYKTCSCEVKPPGFFAGNVTWVVSKTDIKIQKGNQVTQTIPLSDILAVTPIANVSKTAQFKLSSRQNHDSGEQRCTSLQNMKTLLDTIYTNKFLDKYPKQQPQQHPQEPEQSAPVAAEQPAEPPADPAPA